MNPLCSRRRRRDQALDQEIMPMKMMILTRINKLIHHPGSRLSINQKHKLKNKQRSRLRIAILRENTDKKNFPWWRWKARFEYCPANSNLKYTVTNNISNSSACNDNYPWINSDAPL